MRTRPFHQVDVFTAELTRGNPLAVVADADGLSDAQMAAFARWTNLSETTFLLPPRDPQADVRVRIFTPGGELPFAGHPTLGSCAVWLAEGGQPRDPSQVVQECGIGCVRVRRAATPSGRLAFAAPPLQREGALEPAVLAQVQRALGLEAGAIAASQWLVNGPEWATVLLHDDEQLLRLTPDAAALGTLKLGVAAPSRQPGLALEVRAFAPGLGVPEDPVTGSLQAGLALWLIGSGRLSAPYVAAQGAAMGRAGRVHVSRDDEGTWIGGDVVPGIRGTVVL
jgi:PhzF family phenazine biosynthesis protein